MHMYNQSIIRYPPNTRFPNIEKIEHLNYKSWRFLLQNENDLLTTLKVCSLISNFLSFVPALIWLITLFAVTGSMTGLNKIRGLWYVVFISDVCLPAQKKNCRRRRRQIKRHMWVLQEIQICSRNLHLHLITTISLWIAIFRWTWLMDNSPLRTDSE